MSDPDLSSPDTYEKLRKIIFGIDTSLSKTRAMELLLASDFPDNHKDKVFESLLENEAEHWTIRYFAATNLGKMNTQEAKEILNKNTRIKDERVLIGVLKALAYVGDEHTLDTILDVKHRTTGFVAWKAEFASALISYRLGLQGNNLSSPQLQDCLTIPSKFQLMQISVAADQEIRKCLHSLANEQLGIVLAEKPAYQIYYDLGIGMVLFNKDLISERNIHTLSKRKTILGVFADKILDSYSVAYLMLTSPGKHSKMVDLLICSPDGKLNFVGSIKIGIKRVKFAIRSVAKVGIIPILIEGSIKANILDINTAKFSTRIQNKNQPHPIVR